MKTMSSREFNQHMGRAQRAAQTAPVVVTNRSKPAFVFLTYADYQKLTGQKQSALDALTPSAELAAALENIELEIPPRSRAQRPPVDFGMGD
ncbi:type II toxin-antitoxin system Phd/YefM family antitoxin [Neisseria leonii]|uniref:Antitoxin n=1 Tax=Neisseria leonii TaxID=2995413 RepID=A0A9X4E3H4_9NEIS|nr:type II toxin-antitoxin system Phd/YefM family antitoxin [Neisseria sp. 51.81]MDD9328529.1 type II toxin-antitoxin system Phd/YefM family antitoxin [Neisseria sp. 51.81]